MRSAPVLVFACLAAVFAGCGGGDEPRAQRPAPLVNLAVTAPNDLATVRADTVEVRGTVTPAGASVIVVGEAASVTAGGTFTARVTLEPGDNVIDVMATAGGRTPAMMAVRVKREMPVEVPDLDGLEVEEVEQKLADVGLKAEVESRGGLIEDLLPGAPAVCEQDPDPGSQVKRGTTVHVLVGKSC
jgi:glucodextranase-like protein/PASTA domain-containing protein